VPYKSPKCAQKRKRKKKEEDLIPYFRLGFPVLDFDPSFANFMKIRKEGTKSEQAPDWALDWRGLYEKL
jgi:hypothetical protein